MLEALDDSTGLGIPKLGRIVHCARITVTTGTRQQARAVGRESNGDHGADMTLERKQAPARLHVPEDHSVVVACRCEALAVGGKSNRCDQLGVSIEMADELSGSDVPELHARIATAR